MRFKVHHYQLAALILVGLATAAAFTRLQYETTNSNQVLSQYTVQIAEEEVIAVSFSGDKEYISESGIEGKVTINLVQQSSVEDGVLLKIKSYGQCTLDYREAGDSPSYETDSELHLLVVNSTTLQQSAPFYVVAVDDKTYEGTHYCKLLITTNQDASNDSFYPLVNTYYKVLIKDNEPAPIKTEPVETVKEPVKESEPEKPEAPEVVVKDKNNEPVDKDASDKPVFEKDDPVVLSGKTIPKATVKLYIFSEPQEATVTADNDGNWSYTIEGLEEGEHRIEAEVTDPETKLTSDRVEVLAFTVAQIETAPGGNTSVGEAQAADPQPAIWPVATAIAAVALVAGIVSYVHFRKGKDKMTPPKKVKSAEQAPPDNEADAKPKQADED